ncbi:telomeric repeat-binding factor 1 [Aulostomus maculatus]
MEPETETNTYSESDEDGRVPFSQVAAVVSEWMFDFLFVSLCRSFKDGDLDGLNETISTFESLSQRSSLQGEQHVEKTTICAFLARVMHGQQLDVFYEVEKHVTPLMSAFKLWSNLRETVADDSLFENVTILLLVQSVAVCLDKGKRMAALSALRWFEENHEFPKNLRVRLATIVSQRDTYHPFLMNFSYNKLLETVQSFVDTYMEKCPSDYLLKAATKTVQLSWNTEEEEEEEAPPLQDAKPKDKLEKADKSKEGDGLLHVVRTKRRLLSTKTMDVWKPDSCKKPQICLQRTSSSDSQRGILNLPPSELSQLPAPKSTDSSFNQWTPDCCKKAKICLRKLSKSELIEFASKTRGKKRKPHQKWTYYLDEKLKDGVRRHGQGKWSLILQDYDFEGRTSVMLKDRWRTLLKTHKV